MELQRGVCMFCSENNKVVKPSDASDIIEQIPVVLGQVNINEKLKQHIKVCPNCSVKFTLARAQRIKIETNKIRVNNDECVCHFCKDKQNLLQIDTQWKYFIDRSGEFNVNVLDYKLIFVCTECLFFLDSVHCFKANFFRKNPQTKSVTVLKVPKILKKFTKNIVLNNLKPISMLNYKINDNLKLNQQLYNSVPIINLFKERNILEKSQMSYKKLKFKIKLQKKGRKSKTNFKKLNRNGVHSKKNAIPKEVESEIEEISKVTFKLNTVNEFDKLKNDEIKDTNEFDLQLETEVINKEEMDEFDKLKIKEKSVPKSKRKSIQNKTENEPKLRNKRKNTNENTKGKPCTTESTNKETEESELKINHSSNNGEEKQLNNEEFQNDIPQEIDEFDKLKGEKLENRRKSIQNETDKEPKGNISKIDSKRTSGKEKKSGSTEIYNEELQEKEEILKMNSNEQEKEIDEFDILKNETPQKSEESEIVQNETDKISRSESIRKRIRENNKTRKKRDSTEKSNEGLEETEIELKINICNSSRENSIEKEEGIDEFDNLKSETPQKIDKLDKLKGEETEKAKIDEFDDLNNKEEITPVKSKNKFRKSDEIEDSEKREEKKNKRFKSMQNESEDTFDKLKNDVENTPKVNVKVQRRKSIFQKTNEGGSDVNDLEVLKESEDEEVNDDISLDLNDELSMKPSETVPEKIMEEENVFINNTESDLNEAFPNDITDKNLSQFNETTDTDVDFNISSENCSLTEDGTDTLKRKRNSSMFGSGEKEKKKKKVTFFESI